MGICAVSVYDEDLGGSFVRAYTAGKGDALTIRRPDRAGVKAVIVGELLHMRSVSIHYEDFVIWPTVFSGEGNVSTVMRPGRFSIRVVGGELFNVRLI
jgi:hypothetical protein